MAAKYSVIPEEKGIITEELLRNLSGFEGGEKDVYKTLTVAKVATIVVLGLGSFVVGLLPIQLAKWFRWKFSGAGDNSLVISLLLCFGGGVLMFTTFIHLQPEIREEMAELMKVGKAPHFEQLADLVFCVGFFFVYLIEEALHGCLDRKHDHSEDEAFLHRTVSLRRCSKGKDQSGDAAGNQKIIPRVPIGQKPEENSPEMGPKSTSTQVLLDASSLSTAHYCSGNSFEQNYPSKFSPLDPEASNSQFSIYSQYPKTNEKPDDDSTPKDFYQKNFHPIPKSTPGGHSHMLFDDDTNSSSSSSRNSLKLSNTLRGLFTILALSFHAVFEGLAVGLENDVSKVWYLCLAIATHKFVISFCVGVNLLSMKTKTTVIVSYLATFSFVTPLGIGIGIALSSDPTTSSADLSTVILQGIAAGTLLYVVFFEVLQREKANSQSGILQLIAIMAGFGVMFALQFIAGGHHHHHVENLDVSHLLSPSSAEGSASHNNHHHHSHPHH